MKVLAIGATGFIGRHVVHDLVRQGHDVAVLHRGQTCADLPREVRRLRGDRNALEEVLPAIDRFGPQVVLDMILYTEGQARAFVEAFRGRTRRVVVVSSADVYRNYDGFRGKATAPPDPVPLAEDAPLRATRYPYRRYDLPFEWADDYDKILVEQTVLGALGLPSTVLRLPAVYGPGDTKRRLASYLGQMDADHAVIRLDERQACWRWTHGYVENVATAVALTVADERAIGGVYNVGERETPTEAERVRRLGVVVGWTGEVVSVPGERSEHTPEPQETGLDWTYDLATDTSRIRKELGYAEPVSEEVALQRTIAWERANPPNGGA